MAGTYNDAEMSAMRQAALVNLQQLNEDLEHDVHLICWRLRVEAEVTSMVLYYLDGNGSERQHRIIL